MFINCPSTPIFLINFVNIELIISINIHHYEIYIFYTSYINRSLYRLGNARRHNIRSL